MNSNSNLLKSRYVAPMLVLLALAMSLNTAMAYNRIFALRLYNETASNVTFTITPGTCYQGTGVGYFGLGSATGLVHGPVAPGGYTDILVARNQEGCDGEAGYFGISPSTYPGEGQSFAFTNDGMMSQIAPTPNGFSGDLTSTVYNNNTEIFYTWTLKNMEARLSGPLDERLTMPRNSIAKNFGKWDGDSADGGSTQSDTLEFRKNGFTGFEYHECAGIKQFHTQHIVRMPNKNGHAYFVVANSRAYVPDEPFVSAYSNGTLAVYRTDAAPDPVTDLVPNNPGTDGEIVWEHTFDRASPIGRWNHPCKMEMIGNLLLVSMQHYKGSAICRWGDGDEEAVVFYDVRDPENPKYWGKMGAATLGGPHGTPKEVSEVTMSRQGDMWILNAGAWGGGPYNYQSNLFSTKKVGPNIGDWTRFGWESSGGPHGGAFNSFEIYDAPATTPLGIDIPGQERTMFADGGCDNGCPNDSFPWVNPSGDNHVVGDEFLEFSTMIRTPTSVPKTNRLYYPAPNLFPSDNDYDACGPYVTRRGMVVMYAPLEHYPDAAGGDFSADKVYQVWHPANLALETPHPDQVVTTLADDGIGSLRRAIGYGGRITFDPSLNGSTIVLENGPLFVYPYDVNIDASSLPFGISIQGRNFETRALIQVMDPNTLTMSSGLRTMGDPLTSALLDVVTVTSTSLPWATGGAESWFSVTPGFFTPTAAKSGVIANSQATYLQSSVSGPGTLTFWWKVSSEWNFDFLRFTIDGVETAAAPAISGEVGWRQKTVTVPAGSHTLRWTYSKNGSGLDGSDAGWLDQVVFEPVRPEITIEQPVGTPLEVYATVDFGIQLSGSPTTPKTFTIKNTGGVQLNISDVSIDGGQASEFTVNTAGMLTSIPPASQTTFTVTFTPGALGARLDFLQVLSDDPDEGSLLFLLTGTGVAVAPPSLPVAVDAPALVWTSSGNSVWNGQTATTHDGVDAAQSGPLGDIDEGYLETTVTGPGTLTFWWKVSSQENLNFLDLFMTSVGTTAGFAITGEVDWQQRTVIVPTGSTTLRWTYRKTAENFAGSDAAWLDQVVFTPAPPVITSPLTASGTLGEPFNYQIGASNTPTSYNATGLPAGLTVDTSTGLISGTPTVGGNFTVTLTATNAGGSGTATLTLGIATLPPALDAPGLLWETFGGNRAWFGQSVITHDGVDAAQSGPLGNNEGNYLRTTVTGPGTLTFWWKVSSEADFDFMRFRIDGLEQAAAPEISGEVDWVQKTVTVTAGSHTLMWTYGKNESVSAGSDAAWLDQVVFTPPQPEIAIDLPLGTLAAGSVVAWGYDNAGQATVPAEALSGVVAIAGGSNHTVALTSAGKMLAWGADSQGQSTVPTEALTGVSAVSAGGAHSVALKGGKVIAWGWNSNGQSTVPAAALDGVTAISAGTYNTLAVKNGAVFGWGYNGTGQLTIPAEALIGVTAIDLGSNHAVALKGGMVLAWGTNNAGQTTVPAEALDGVTAIAAGAEHTVALKGGTVLVWGGNSQGQRTVPTEATSNVVAIDAGDYYTMALKSNGEVVAWGYSFPAGVPTAPAGLGPVTAIAAGSNHTLALLGTSAVDFGSQPIGVAGPWKTFTIKNTGSAALSITSVSVVGFNSGDFAVDSSGMLTSVPAAGQTTFRVLFNAGAAGARPIILRVLNDDADESITDITLTGTGINLTALDTWRLLHFGNNENSGNGADLNDFDKDGIVNLVEFAFGLNPTQNSAGLIPQAQRIGPNFVTSFAQAAGVSGITFGAEWTTSLLSGSWTPIPDTGTTPQHVFSWPVGSNTKMFMRLRVTDP